MLQLQVLCGNVELLMVAPFECESPLTTEEVFNVTDGLREAVAVAIIKHRLDLVLSLADKASMPDRGFMPHEEPAKPLSIDLKFRNSVLW